MPSVNSTPQRMMIVSSPAAGSYSASKPPGALLSPAPGAPGVRSVPRRMPSAAHASASASSSGGRGVLAREHALAGEHARERRVARSDRDGRDLAGGEHLPEGGVAEP